jgi:hypothetical protein
MESNNNDNNYDGKGQQLGRSPRKRKFSELTNDGQPAATEEEQKQHQPPENLSKKKHGHGNDDLEVCV